MDRFRGMTEGLLRRVVERVLKYLGKVHYSETRTRARGAANSAARYG